LALAIEAIDFLIETRTLNDHFADDAHEFVQAREVDADDVRGRDERGVFGIVIGGVWICGGGLRLIGQFGGDAVGFPCGDVSGSFFERD
jgi:hypothetical protein